VVSLVRTLTESFGSASDLYRKLKRKSKEGSSSSEDAKEERGKRRRKWSQKERDPSAGSKHGHGRHHQVRWNIDSKQDYSDSDEELIRTSSSQILAEYDRGYQQLGEGFARGDCITSPSTGTSCANVTEW
jgi:hypothetical protein